jgi:hypothetical protein
MVDAHNLWLAPVAGLTTPALRMPLPSFLIRLLSDGADRVSFTVMPLVGGHVLDAAVPTLSVTPVDKAIHPGFYREQSPEPPQRITLVVFHGAEP